jgi:hypothetical protein
MRIDLPLQDFDLLVESPQYRDGGAGGGRVDRGEYLGLAQMLTAQHGLDLGGRLRDVTAAGAGERGTVLGDRQPRRRGRLRCLGQQLQSIGGIQILTRFQRDWEILAQRMTQRLGVAGTFGSV